MSGTTWKAVITAAAIGVSASVAQAAALIAYDTAGVTNSGPWYPTWSPGEGGTVTVDPAVTLSQGLTLGAGLTEGSGVTNTWGGANWGTPSAPYTTLADAVAADEYYTLTFDASGDNKVSLTSVAFNLRRLATSPNTYQLQYSLDSGAFVSVGSPTIDNRDNGDNANGFAQAVTLNSITDLQNTDATITLRLVLWGSETGAAAPNFAAIGKLGGNDFIVNGDVIAVPEPTAFLVALGIAARLRRRVRR